MVPRNQPLLRQHPHKIRPRPRQLIIHSPPTSNQTLPALDGLTKHKQTHDITHIRVKDNLSIRIRRQRELLLIRFSTIFTEVRNMRHHHVCRLTSILVVLAAEDGPDMGRQADVDDDVLDARVVVDGDVAEEGEAVAGVYVL